VIRLLALVLTVPVLVGATVPPKRAVPVAMAGLPTWTPPPAYSEKLVIDTDGKKMAMDRSIDHGKMRTDMTVDGKGFTMIELGDEKGTSYMLMPEQKRAMKQSRAGMARMAKADTPDSTAQDEPEAKVENLGDDTVDGVAARKVRWTTDEGAVLAWFDKASGAPLRMESDAEGKHTVMSWQDRKVGPQPEEKFAIPKDYEVTDMDEMMKKMGGMGGMGGLGMMGKGMAGGMAGGLGSSMGGNLGAMLGGSIGGPIGSLAGRFIGGKIGGALGHKAAAAVIH
jgi:hypothetical protein